MQVKLNVSVNDLKDQLIQSIKNNNHIELSRKDITVKVILKDGDTPQDFVKLDFEVNK